MEDIGHKQESKSTDFDIRQAGVQVLALLLIAV